MAAPTKTTATANTAKTQAQKGTEGYKGTENPKQDPQKALEWLETIKTLSIHDALTLAQGEMYNPAKTSTGKMPTKSGSYEFKFAGFDVITAIIRPACNKWGLFFTQPITSEIDEKGNSREFLHTRVYKGSEMIELAKMELPRDYRDVKSRGGDITYFQRQEAKAVFVLAGDDDVSDQSGDFTNEIPKYAQSYDQPYQKVDKEDEQRKQTLILEDRLAEMEDRRTVAKSMGLTQDGYRSWFKENINKPESQMTLGDVDKTIAFLDQNIADFKAIKGAGSDDQYDTDVPF